MFGRKCVVYFLVVTSFWSFNAAANSCVVMETCILPCSFTPGDELVLHWIQGLAGNTPVHSFYHNKDQPALQDPRYRGRTSLFPDQIPRGNGSLELRRVQVQDQGRYKCYSSTITGNAEAFVELKVEAPVREVKVQHQGNRITCSSEGIYPQPVLSWSSGPESTVMNPEEEPRVQKNDQQLYSISSSISLQGNSQDLVSCTVSVQGKGRRTTLFKTSEVTRTPGGNVTMSCTKLNPPETQLTWRFNQHEVVVTRVSPEQEASVSEGWRQQVEVSESGSLTLTHLSPGQQGTYTCEVSNTQETYVTSTTLRVEEEEEEPAASFSTAGIAGVVVGVVLAVVAVIVVALIICRRCCSKKTSNNVL